MKPNLWHRFRAAAAAFRADAGDQRITSPRQLAMALSGLKSASGARVSAETAMSVTAVFACVRVLGETVGSLPLHVYRYLPSGGKERAYQHPNYRLLNARPNHLQTPMEFREMLTGHAALRGNGYAEIQRVRGQVDELIPLHPDRVRPKLTEGGELVYEVLPLMGNAAPRTLRQDQVFHLRGFSSDGFTGRSPMGDGRDTIGLALDAQDFVAASYLRGGRKRIALSVPGLLDAGASKRMAQSWVEANGGADGYSLPAVLEQGMKPEDIGITASELQLIEERKFSIEDIARLFRVPLHLIGHLERSTNNNIEQQALEFVVHTIRPWLVRWEQALQRSLFTAPMDADYFPEHLVDGLLRGDIKSRYDAYQSAISYGILSPDEVREMENRNPRPDGLGGKYLRPGNMVLADAPNPEPAPAQQAAQETSAHA